MEDKYVLVVGGAGFIGSNMIDLLLSKGKKILAVDNFLLGSLENIRHLENNHNFTFEEADFFDINIVDSIFSNYKIDEVYHFAANSDIQASSINPEIDFNNTFMTTYNILVTMKKYNVSKLIFASSSAVYGDMGNCVIDEDIGPLFPESYYGSAKLASEAFISSYVKMNDMNVWICRFPNVIGDRSTHGVVYDFVKKLSNNPNELKILGDGRQKKTYLYVKDLIEAILYIRLNTSDCINYFNIGNTSTTEVTTIADIVCEELGLSGVKYSYSGGSKGWKGDVPKFNYNVSKLEQLGWKAKYTSDQAVRISAQKLIEEFSNE